MIFPFCVNGQKLPGTQEASAKAPKNIKIDGKPIEWKDFKAYNNSTGIYYTISNDDANLYLALQAKDYDVINRILAGGVTLNIQKSRDKNDINRISITYPVPDSKHPVILSLRPLYNEIPDTSTRYRDSIMKFHNQILAQNFKSISVYGINGIDSVISIYNENGIKAYAQFDNKKIYTLEMSIKLNALNLSPLKNETFTYHLQINGAKFSNDLHPNILGTPEAVARILAAHEAAEAKRAATTDFWASYTLLN